MGSENEDGPLILRHDESMLKTEVTEEELQFRNSINIDNDKLKSEKINCTSCNKNLKDYILTKLEYYTHPCLQVLICEPCFEFYSTGAFTPDDDGTDQFCRWCGQGGNLICCSRCTVVICDKCVKLNFPKEYRKETEKDDWLCFICDTKPIWPIRALAYTAVQYVENRKKKQLKRRGIDKDESADSKRSRRSESDENDEVEPTKLRRSRKKDEAAGSKRSRRYKSSEDESFERKKSSRLREKVAKKNRDTRSISSERKTKQRKSTKLLIDSSLDDSDDSEKVRLRKSKTAETKSSRKAPRSSDEKVEIESRSKNEFSVLLRHCITDSVMDYSKLIKVMTKSHKNYVGAYLKNKKLWMDDDGKQKLIDEYKELLTKTKDSMDKLERTFLASMKNLNLSPTNEEDETERALKIEPMSVDEEVEKTENDEGRLADNESVNRSTQEKIAESKNDTEVIDKMEEDERNRSKNSTDEVEMKEHRQSTETAKTVDEEADVESTNTTNLETAGENCEKTSQESKSGTGEESHLDKGNDLDSSKENDYEKSKTDDADESVLNDKMNPEENGIMIDNENGNTTDLDSASLLVHVDSFDEKNKSLRNDEEGSKEKETPSDTPLNVTVQSNAEENENNTIDFDKEMVAKATLLNSPRASLSPISSSSEDNDNDLMNSFSLEKIAKTSLLESSNTDNGNDEELKSTDSTVGEDKRQSRKRKVKKHERSKTERNDNDTDDDDDKEIDRLTRLNNLNLRRGKCSKSDCEDDEMVSSEKENRMDNTDNSNKRLSLRTKKTKKSAADFISDGSGSGDECDDDMGELSFDNFNSLQEQKEKEHTMNRDDISKKLLLMDSDSDVLKSDSESDDDITDIINKSIKEKKKKKCDSHSKKTEDENSDSDDSGTLKSKSDKANWRNDRLLRGKLSDTDTSDDERAIAKARLKDRDEKERKAAKRNAKGSESSDSEDLFRPRLNTKKVKKRKMNLSSSVSQTSDEFSSNSSSVEIISDHETKSKKKPVSKRKRVRGAWESSDSENGDKNTSQTGSLSKGRKNIRKIIGEDDLDEMTRKTAKAEEDRRKRLAEKQALFEQSFKIPDDKEDHLDNLVLDFDPKTKKEIITVHPKLLKKLKPHQAKGVKFMWDSCFESVKQIEKNKGGGCILAHCMGLGKTLQVITLVHTVLHYSELTKMKRVMIICPLSTVSNWVHEFEHWLKNIDDNDFDVDDLHKRKNYAVRADYLKRWHREGGVMIIGYNMFRNLVTNKKLKKSIKESIDEALLDPGPDLVICDEGHILKNESSGVSLATMQIKTLRRIVLTGTPLQNNLTEYHCMVQFVKPNLLGTKKEFLNRFVNPITNGQYTNSTEKDVKVMKRRAHVLHKMLDGIVQRFDYKVLMPFLPPKHEFVISVALSDLQAKLYEHYIKTYSRMSNQTTSLFKDYQIMRLIWTHPFAMKLSADRAAKVKQIEDDADSIKDFIVSASDDESSSRSDSSVVSINSEKNDAGAKNSTKKNGKNEEEEVIDLENNLVTSPWFSEFISSEDTEDYKQGPKLVLLFAILRECENRGDKVLIFSQSIPSLDMIEYFLDKTEELSQYAPLLERANMSHIGNWQKNADYFRLDGSTPSELRTRYCNAFNRESNKRARLFLISTKAGGLGINLTAANRVIIFDASWNPSHDVQSIFRVFRFGQSKPCYIYRFLSQGTMEEKIYERQVTKLSISCRVVDEQQIDRHFSRNEIEELYTFNRKIPDENETPKLPNDDLMAELLKEYKKYIISYHEHDSLLENIVDEELTEEERKQAWEEYENDKKPKLIAPMSTKTVGITENDIIAAVRREHPHASPDKVMTFVNQVKSRLIMAEQLTMQQQQAMHANNSQNSQQNELRKAAYRYQMQPPLRKENQPPTVNQVVTDGGKSFQAEP